MRRLLLTLLVFASVAVPALCQSGRKGASPKPPAVPAPTGKSDKLRLTQSQPAKPSPPEIVDGERIYQRKEVDEPYEILRKPEAHYNRDARRHQTHGYVIVSAILAADETIKHIEILTGLPDGLSEEAIKAAQQIKFKPAKKDGKPVSVWIEVEYRFEIY